MYLAKLKDKANKGCGSTVEIFKDNEKVGEFDRNYNSFGVETFAPFEKDGKWFALYSPSYVALSVMALPSCKYIGGEDQKDPYGFCPVEVYIPRFQWDFAPAEPLDKLKIYPEENRHWLSKNRYLKEYIEVDEDIDPNKEMFYENFALIAGCYFGSDWAWEIQLRDISRAHEGIITTLPHLNAELPRNIDLKDVVHLSAFEQYSKEDVTSINLELTVRKYFRLQSNDKNILWGEI